MIDPFSQFYTSNIIGLMWLQIAIFLSLIFINRKHILQEFKKMDKRYLYVLLILVIFSAAIYINHVGNFQEIKALTLVTAKGFYTNNLNFFYNDGEGVKAQIDKRDPYPYGPFYPFLLSITFQLFGPEPQLIHLLDVILFFSFLITIFLLFYMLFRDEKTSLLVVIFSSAIFFYTHINRCAGIQPELFFLMVTLSLMLMFISLKGNTRNLYLLFMVSLLLTIETNVETGILMMVFMAGIFIYRKDDIRKVHDFWIRKIFPAFALILLFSPIFITHSASHYFVSKNNIFYNIGDIAHFLFGAHIHNPISDFTFSLNNFIYLWSTGLYTLLTSLFLVGLFFMIKKEKKICFLLLLTFILHNFIFFLWNNGYQDRYAFTTIIPYIIILNFSFFSVLKVKKVKRYKNYLQIPIFISAFFILIFSVNFFNSTANISPYNFNEIQKNLYNFTEFVEDRDANIIILSNDGFLMSKIEFLTMKSVFIFHELIFIYGNTSDYDFRGGMEFNASEEADKKEKFNSLVYSALKRMSSEPDIKNSIRETILIGETYLVDDSCSLGMHTETLRETVLNIFGYDIVDESECFKIYRLN